jgi:cyclopropane fatty-acyl-phospholipid synthase-like methyltransferase
MMNANRYRDDLLSTYSDWKEWREETFGICTAVAAHYFHAEFRRSGIEFSSGDILLELGFGNGELAAWAARQDLSYLGTELNPRLLELARLQGFEVFPATLDLQSIVRGRPIRCVVAFDVLEHLTVSDIAALFQSVSSTLAPGGYFLARFPSGDSPFARSIQYGDFTHQTVIGSSAVVQLARTCGLNVVQLRAPILPIWGLGARVAARRFALRAARAVIGRVVNLVYHDNCPRVVEPTMLIVLQRA